MATIRKLLKSTVTRGEIEYMALDYDWKLHTPRQPTDTGGAYKVWLEGEGESQSVIIYIEDGLAELRYLSVEGVNAVACINQIVASVEVYTPEELEADIEHARRPEELIPALRRLGASLSVTFEPWAFAELCKGVKHPDPLVRLAAIAAIGFPAWREFIEPITEVQETDSDERVLRRAARMLGLLQQALMPKDR
jgi:HEAT repeat protein